MVTTQITINTSQATGLQEIHHEFIQEVEHLRQAAPKAVKRGPGMLARADVLDARAVLLGQLIEQVPTEVMQPPSWVADGICQVPGDRWPYLVQDQDGGVWSSSAGEQVSVEELIERGARRLDAVERAAGQMPEGHEAQQSDVEPESDDESDDEDSDDSDEDLPLPGLVPDTAQEEIGDDAAVEMIQPPAAAIATPSDDDDEAETSA